MKFCFVILHYKTAEDTLKCIESIKRLSSEKSIVVVDNASNNGSIEKVIAIYGKASNLYFIKNEKNIGFADGNNVGYKFAKEELGADFIAISNNDIVVDTLDFVDKINLLYQEEHFYIAGPDIVSLVGGIHQSPMNSEKKSAIQVTKEIRRYQILYWLSVIGIYDLLKREKRNSVSFENKIRIRTNNVQLHGAFLIYSKAYIEKEDAAFIPGTFLYMEEAILFNYCIKKDYKTVFEPDLRVFHKEDSSTRSLFVGNKAKREFIFKNMIRSLKVYRDVLRSS